MGDETLSPSSCAERRSFPPQALSICQQLYFLCRLPAPCLLMAPGLALLLLWSWAQQKRGPGVPAERCPEAAETGGGACSQHKHGPKEPEQLPEGWGEPMWDKTTSATHPVLPMGCAASALPRLGGVGNLSIPVRAASPRQRGWGCSQPAGSPHRCPLIPPTGPSSWNWLASHTGHPQ